MSTEHRRFVWAGTGGGTGASSASGWLMLMELNGLQSNAVVRKYTWGLDLAGQSGEQTSGLSGLEGAGGIAGLLAVEQPQGAGSPLKYVYLYGGNGNVGQVIDPLANNASASMKVKYEYDPYGTRTNTAQYGEFDQAFRFSTKYFDAESGLYYFAYRYYHPKLGRWMNHDPVFEDGGWDLYRFVENNPLNLIDPDGQKARVSVDAGACTITVTLNIGIYGKKASDDLANKIKSCIESHWNGHTTKKGCAEKDPGSCKVVVVANVKYYKDANHWPDVPAENQIKIPGQTSGSWVICPGGSYGHWEDDTVTDKNPDPCWSFAHEAGHLMGLGDDYIRNIFTGEGIVLPGQSGHIMAERGGSVTQREIDRILQGKNCPKECCCPPTSKPASQPSGTR